MMPEEVWLGEHLGVGRFSIKLWTYPDGSQRLSVWDYKEHKLVFEKDYPNGS